MLLDHIQQSTDRRSHELEARDLRLVQFVFIYS